MMSSGYFPLRRDDPQGMKLLQAVQLISEVISEQYGAAQELDCAEDGVSDGITLGELMLARTLIEGAVQKKS